MAVRVRVQNLRLDTAVLLDKVANTPALRKKVRSKLKSKFQDHAHNVVYQVGRMLNVSVGFPGGIGFGQKTLRVTDGDGKPLSVTTPFWFELSKKYARRYPLSTRFWNKRRLQHNSLAKLYNSFVKPSELKVSVTTTKSPRSHHKRMVTLHSRIDLVSPYNYVINRLLLVPFMSGDEASAAGFEARDLIRNSPQLLGYPEAGPYQRPFVARMAAYLGRRAQTALRRLNFN